MLASAANTVMITAVAPLVTLAATDADAAEAGMNQRLAVSRTGDTSFALTVANAVAGTATNGFDYVDPNRRPIPAGSQRLLLRSRRLMTASLRIAKASCGP